MAPEPGLEFKAWFLKLCLQNCGVVGQILGCAPESIPSILAEWEPRENWADARVIALIAARYQITVVAWDQRQSSLEIVTPFPDSIATRQCWLLRYGNDHYDPGVQPDANYIASLISPSGYLPWAPTKTGRGGASDPRNLLNVRCLTHNLGGWAQNQDKLKEFLPSEGPSVTLLQETHLSTDSVKTASATLRRQGFQSLWTPGAQRKRVKSGHVRVDWGTCPGVGMVASDSIDLLPRPPRTPGGRRWWEGGRLLMAQIKVLGIPLLLLCLYAPAGREQADTRATFFSDMQKELAAQDTHAYLIGGDYNMSIHDTTLAAAVHTDGSFIPLLQDGLGNSVSVTYISGAASSCIDGFLAGPDATCATVQKCHSIAGSPHAVISLDCKCDSIGDRGRVGRPISLRPRKTSEPCEINWDSLLTQMQRLAPKDPGPNFQDRAMIQSLIDDMWGMFTCAYRAHVSGTRVPCTQDGAPLRTADVGALKLGEHHSSQHKRTSVATGAYQRLVSLARHEGNLGRSTHWFAAHQKEIAHTLGMNPEMVAAALADPDCHVEKWRDALRSHYHHERTHRLTQWRQELTAEGRPSPRLYRWVRGLPAAPPLALRHDGIDAIGLTQVFTALRHHWMTIMSPVNDSEAKLGHWLSHPSGLGYPEAPPFDPALVVRAARSLDCSAAPGPDNWPVAALRLIHEESARVLLFLWRVFSLHSCWPSSLQVVRTQMVPKSENAIALDEQRPISVMSVWYRLWSRAALISIPSETLELLHPHLRGGLGVRTLSDSILTWALQVEGAINSFPSPSTNDPMALYMVTIDASKCFDRISQQQLLERALKLGLHTHHVSMLAAFHLDLKRVLSYGGLVDEYMYHPTIGIPQGCAMSALLCGSWWMGGLTWLKKPVVSRKLMWMIVLYMLPNHTHSSARGAPVVSGMRVLVGKPTGKRRLLLPFRRALAHIWNILTRN